MLVKRNKTRSIYTFELFAHLKKIGKLKLFLFSFSFEFFILLYFKFFFLFGQKDENCTYYIASEEHYQPISDSLVSPFLIESMLTPLIKSPKSVENSNSLAASW